MVVGQEETEKQNQSKESLQSITTLRFAARFISTDCTSVSQNGRGYNLLTFVLCLQKVLGTFKLANVSEMFVPLGRVFQSLVATILVKFSVYIVCPSVLSLNNIKLPEP